MLDWMKGNEGDAADTSKVLEPPETPAPVFAMRAFKSALFGTPGAEEEDKHVSQPKPSGHQRSKSDTTNPIIVEKEDPKLEHDATFNPSGSPTKSILVTPGTIANRRKTVSFGEGVVDNEGKRDARITKTPPNPAGNITTQWMSGSADGKPRSKLTQTLMDARDNASKNAESSTEPMPDSASDAKPVTRSLSKDEATIEDITLNLDEPRSESGKYWKTEFDNYRVRTNREIKKLIHYRSVAKSYARKKDSESLRLADKLREEEEKVVEMERQVSRLASAIVGESSQAGKDGLIQDLTKQTTLALQYKQQVNSLRKSLEQQGVVKSDAVQVPGPTKEEQPSANSSELRKAQQELKQANAQIEEMKRQNPDLSTLQSLAQSSEKKAQDLEKENNSLKQTLARVKQEMLRYEGRRKEKETKLKQREAKLEARIQEYRARLKTTSQEHRASEEALRANFEEERRRMQNQIDLLKLRSASTDRGPALRPQQRHSLSPRKEYPGVHVYDFAGNDHPEVEEEATEDVEAPASPSPRSKTRQARNATTSALDVKRAVRDVAADDDEVTHYLNQILPKQHHGVYPERNAIPPSSPPDIAPLKSLNRAHTKYQSTRDGQRTYRSLYLRDPDNADTGHAHAQRPGAHIKSTLDSISGLPGSRANYAGYTISAGERSTRRGLADMRGELLSPERVAAAKSRLKQKHDSRKGKALTGKENF